MPLTKLNKPHKLLWMLKSKPIMLQTALFKHPKGLFNLLKMLLIMQIAQLMMLKVPTKVLNKLQILPPKLMKLISRPKVMLKVHSNTPKLLVNLP